MTAERCCITVEMHYLRFISFWIANTI